MMNTLNKRIAQIEYKLNPPLKALIVFVREEDKTSEIAIERVKRAYGINVLPDDLPICVFNFLNPNLKNAEKMQE